MSSKRQLIPPSHHAIGMKFRPLAPGQAGERIDSDGVPVERAEAVTAGHQDTILSSTASRGGHGTRRSPQITSLPDTYV